ncbi:MAG: DUF1326 domain-containing protein [SAR202 cluster bacterium]|nr:DUF1326 domain-containing protein [SAR202 cluster bacterium]
MSTEWKISGDYFENCNCDYVCPCIITNMAAEPTHGSCKAGLVMSITDGSFGELSLGGVKFVVMVMTEGPMIDGNWTVGLIVDDTASDQQVEAIGAICSGDVGGPMENASALVGNFAGIERAKIDVDHAAMSFSVTAGELASVGAEMIPSMGDPEQPLYIDNAGHPANTRLALGKATNTRFNVFGIEWESSDGRNNGHMAPFDWNGVA